MILVFLVGGARFDPYAPPGVPAFEPNPFVSLETIEPREIELQGPQPFHPSGLETIEPREIELQGPQPFHPSGVVVPPVYPTVGCSDLLPGPGAGIYPIRGGFGGMLVGPNDPRFFGGVGGEPGFPGCSI
ncbi:unnamed protein product [Ilex paraguariensis]|uniref:Uncharacterized protein n=1 Tax=Ilex paraguariensis TaxID=185542 RepID=A0ABC8S2G7_9AQUA